MMPTRSKIHRKCLGKLKSIERAKPERPCKSRVGARRLKSVSPSRSRWRDDIRKMKSWREAAKIFPKHFASSLSKNKSGAKLKERGRSKTLSRTNQIVVSSETLFRDIHVYKYTTTGQTLDEENQFQRTIPSKDLIPMKNTEKVLLGY